MAQPTGTVTLPVDDHGASPRPASRARNLLVIGATRGTGRHFLEQALAAGHSVTALARDPARVDVAHERLRVLRGDVMAAASLAPAMAGQDAVISSLGTTTGRAPTTLYSEGTRNII